MDISPHSMESVMGRCADSKILLGWAHQIVITNTNAWCIENKSRAEDPLSLHGMDLDLPVYSRPSVRRRGRYKPKVWDTAHDYITAAKEEWRIEREIEAEDREKADRVFIDNPDQETIEIFRLNVYKNKGELRCYANKMLDNDDDFNDEDLNDDDGNDEEENDDGVIRNRLLLNIPICISWHKDQAFSTKHIPWPKQNEHKRHRWVEVQHRKYSALGPRAYRPVEGGVTWVHDTDELHKFLLLLPHIKKCRPELACDCEGVNLGRNGSLTHLSIFILSFNHTYILCLHEFNRGVFNPITKIVLLKPTLRGNPTYCTSYEQKYFATVFDTTVNDISLRRVLKDEEVGQLWFDVRGDADALYKHHGIKLGHVFDIQLLELLSRYGSRKFVMGLAWCVQTHGLKFMHPNDQRNWLRAKNAGKDFFRNTYGNNPLEWKILEEVPLPDIVKNYTAGDVDILFKLYEYFIPRLELMSRYLEMPNMLPLLQMIDDASRTRAYESTTDQYDPDADGKNIAPIPPADLEIIDISGSVNHYIPVGKPFLEDPNGVQGEAYTDGTYKNPYQTHTLVHGKYRGTAGVVSDETVRYRCKVNRVWKKRRPITWFPPDSVQAALAALWTNEIKRNHRTI